MFNEKHQIGRGSNSGQYLSFLGSKYVKVFPCGRRRAYKNDGTPIPFDSEAKLNTELNNRKVSGLNSINESFYVGQEWSTDLLRLVIGGYSFEIELADGYKEIFNFCTEATDFIGNNDKNAIYANIKLSKVQIYESNDSSYDSSNALDSYTWVLKNQSNDYNISHLDIRIKDDPSTVDDFYFSGLSFSTYPLVDSMATDTDYAHSDIYSSDNVTQQDFSIKLLINDNGWKLNPAVLLPELSHGDTDKSVRFTELQADKMVQFVGEDRVKFDVPAMAINYKESDGEDSVYQLKFYNIDVKQSNQ
jgi:hypothetical protein